MLDSVKHILRIWVEGEFLVFEDYAFRGGRTFSSLRSFTVFARPCAHRWRIVENGLDLVLFLEEVDVNQ